jgi:DNA-binding transcriptional LysR family regulator
VELRHLKYFVAVAEELSFTRAAHRLGMAQPPLSQQVARLERELGVALLERTSRSVRLTRAGAALLAEARVLLTRSEEAVRIVGQVGHGESGAVRIGSVASAFSSVLLHALRAYREAYPAVLPLVYEMEATPQLEALIHRTIDIGFLRSPGPHLGVDIWPLPAESLVAVLPGEHPAVHRAGRRRLPLSELAGERFVMFPRASAPDAYDTIIQACRVGGFTPDVVYEATNDHTLVSLVAAGLGVSLVPRSTSSMRIKGAVYRRTEPDCPAARLGAALPAQGASEPAARLLEVVRAVTAEVD